MTTLALAAIHSALPSPEARGRRAALYGAIAIAVWVLAFGAWSAVAPIAGGVIATGLVKVDANRRTVTHRDGGTVAGIRVREGQAVRRGDVLIELEDVRVDASVDLLRAQLGADLLRQSRLEAETAAQAAWSPPPALMREFAATPGFAEQARKEARTFATRQSNLAAQATGERAQSDSAHAEIAARTHERENSRQALELMRDELQLNEKLASEHFVNRTRLLELQRAVSEYESRRLSNEADLAQAQQRLAASQLRLRALGDGFVQSAAEEARELGPRIGDTRQRLRSSSDDQARQTVVAPEDGVLVNLRVNTIGSALGAREPIVDVVPSGAPLVIEARLPLEVAADVRAGALADVRILTTQSRYETLLPGRVSQVSADAVSDEHTGQPYLRAQIEISREVLASHGTTLQPGMAAEVHIKVSERTALAYLAEPITAFFRRALRER